VKYCTVVEFEWEDAAQREAFEQLTLAGGGIVDGRLVRVIGVDDAGARAIEVWASPDDARRFAERTAPDLGSTALPAPSRVFGFEVSAFEVA